MKTIAQFTMALHIVCLMISSPCIAQWQQTGNDIDGEATEDYSGRSVSLNSDGSVVAIGASDNDGNGTAAGHVRVYELIAGNWAQKGSDIDGEAAGDLSGKSISLNADGDVLAIGAENNDGNGNNAGHIRVYQCIDGNWIQKGSDIDGEAAYDLSGYSVSINNSGNVVAIGAVGNNGNGISLGHVRVYAFFSPGGWIQRGNDIDGEVNYDHSGDSVSLNGDGTVVAIGAPVNGGNGNYSGHVRVFQYGSSFDWIQRGNDIDGEATGDFSGGSVSLNSSGNYVAIGAVQNDGNGQGSGHARVYQYVGVWNQIGNDIDGEAAGDGSGNSVSINADGSMVAIGAFFNDGNGYGSGHVRVYHHTFGTAFWRQIGNDIDGEYDDQSGIAVSLSDNGDKVAIGAYSNDNANGIDSGRVRVYSNTTLGTEQYDLFEDILLFPNPTYGEITLHSKKTEPITSIHLLDISGKLLKIQKQNCSTCFLNLLNNESPGFYFLIINTASGTSTKKIILK